MSTGSHWSITPPYLNLSALSNITDTFNTQSQFNSQVANMLNGLGIEVANLISMIQWIKDAHPEVIVGYHAIKDIKEKVNE